ncbi:DUF1992 domain-containing protein [Micropruina sonneratiae]|uniref:DnaJ family domain-containing protein n=1 Tax=Micropruina sonneratiae TaxID=2986940 RepID=UPI0022278F2A|nr:DUF1992 domain-containing protein [Micropruina sp. KQZ13P-5]MCW3156550.1 DUF1992 domain-containing protein [Micropruina sp. KQZ13P-5]
MQYESWIDRQIREAIERGEFDNLPGAGQPLQLDPDEDWWIKAKLKRENLEPVLPGPLMLRREAERIQQTLDDVRDESTARAIVEDLNSRIREHYLRPALGPTVVVRLVDVETELATWRQRRTR